YQSIVCIAVGSGRGCTCADDERALRVAIVDEAMSAQYWRGADPIGRRLRANGQWLAVVGVARAAEYRNLLETPKPFFYVPLRQSSSPGAGLQIRTRQGPSAIAPALVRELRSLDANVVPGELITMREQVDRTTAPQRIAVTILIVFGGLALLLA